MSTRKPQMLRIVRIPPGPVAPTEGSNEHDSTCLGLAQLPVPPQAQDSLRLPFPKRLGTQDLANGEMKMSPHEHRVSSFVGDLVEMARSHEELPKVREAYAMAQSEITTYLDMIQRLELKIIDHKNTEDSLRSQIRAAEVARDDAELRFLEAEDRTEKAVAFVRTVFGNAGQLIQALEPPKPEPIASEASEPQVPVGDLPLSETGLNVSSSNPAAEAPSTGSNDFSEVSGERAPRPTSDGATSTTDTPQTGAGPQTVPEPGIVATGEITGTANVDSQTGGVSVSADPIVNQDVSSMTTDVPTSTSAPSGPYSDHKYYDYPRHVSLSDWLAGGGTEDSYNWRPWHHGSAA